MDDLLLLLHRVKIFESPQRLSDGSLGTTTTCKDVLGRTVRTVYADGSYTEMLYSVGDKTVPSYSAFDIPPGGSQTVSIAQHTDSTPADKIEATIRIYDKAGRLHYVKVYELNGVSYTTPQVTTYTYDAAGDVATTAEDEGTSDTSDDLVTTDTYDDLNRLDTLTQTRGGVNVFFQDFSYTSDSQKHDVLEKRYSTGGGTFTSTRITWEYDADNRLQSETRDEGDDQTQNGGDYTDAFTYDLNGNRISKTHDELDTDYDSSTTSEYNDRDELTSDTTGGATTSYTYDADGNTTSESGSGGTAKYLWDLRNRLVAVDGNGDDLAIDTAGTSSGTVDDASDSTYRYDDTGARVGKTTGGHTTVFLNDTQNPTGYAKPIEESIDGTLSRSYVIGLDVLAQADVTNGETAILRDGRGYARTLIGGTEIVSPTIDVDAFGNILNSLAPDTPFESPDGYYDVETGSYYQLARYRQDDRFLSQDSIKQSQRDLSNANLFSFMASDPLSGTDPSGHFAELLAVSGIDMRRRS